MYNHSTVCYEMNSDSFKNKITDKLLTYKYMYNYFT